MRLYQLQPYMCDDKSMISFSSKARSVEGVFRSFLKNSLASCLKNGTMYLLYVSDFYGYHCVGRAYFNGKAFVEVVYKAVDGKMYRKNNEGLFYETFSV